MRREQPVVLYFHPDAAKAIHLNGICREMGIRFLSVGAAYEHAPIGLLSGTENRQAFSREDGQGKDAAGSRENGREEKKEVSDLTEELLVMARFDEKTMDSFLAKMRARRVIISLKAIQTPHNAMWSAVTLAEELAKERDSIRARITRSDGPRIP